MSQVELTFVILGGIGSFLSGILMLITFIRVVTKLQLKEEVIYGAEATKRYENIKNTLLKEGKDTDPYIYEGGTNKIVPRLEFEKCNFNSIIMDPYYKGCKRRVRYFYIGDDKQRYVKTWYLK